MAACDVKNKPRRYIVLYLNKEISNSRIREFPIEGQQRSVKQASVNNYHE